MKLEVTSASTATLNYLIKRVCYPDASWVGASSTAMLRVALGESDYPSSWPSDDGDLRRCEETYRRAPGDLQALMRPWLEQFREHVSVGGLRCRGCGTSGHTGTTGDLCRACCDAGVTRFHESD